MRASGIQDLPFAAFSENERREAHQWVREAGDNVVIKPVDGSGSKGVSIRPQEHELEAALDYALASSPSRRFIIEFFVPRIGRQVGGDGFFEGGRLVFACFGESFSIPGLSQPDILSKLFPCSHDAASLDQLRDLIERSGRAAGLHSGPVNFDALIRPDGTPFLIEMAARNGGNYLCHMIARQTGVDLMAAAVEIALDQDWKLPSAPVVEPRWHASWVLYSGKSGVLHSLELDSEIAPHVVEFHPHAMPGTVVSSFKKAGDSLGVVILRFDSLCQMDEMMPHMNRWCRVKMEGDA
jgi:biotin carboxylase